MGQLYDIKEKASAAIAQKSMDQVKTMGQIGLKCGFLLAFIRPDTPDEPAKIDSLRKAIKEVIGIDV